LGFYQYIQNESASSFIKQFTYSKTTAEAASNVYTTDQLVDFILASLRPTKIDVYKTALQLYWLERQHGKMFTAREIEQNLFQINEEIGRDKRSSCTEHAMATNKQIKQCQQI
jgi:hypothetical protein